MPASRETISKTYLYISKIIVVTVHTQRDRNCRNVLSALLKDSMEEIVVLFFRF